MKKRAAAAKKPAARKSAAKKSTKSSKAEKPAPTAERTAERAVAGGKYTPTPIQGIGWAPFRYPA
jgi:hypothetical protein